MELMKPMDMFQMLKILTRVLTKVTVVLDNQHHQQEDGYLRVFKWPSMALIIDKADAHPTLKDLDFSLDGRFLVSLGGGPCLIWDVETTTIVASILRENRSLNGNGSQILHVTTMRDRGGSIVSFDTSSWTRVSSKHVVPDPISAFSVSPDGELLAM
ncbi:hypothetical protein C5167_001309 [Papaver somniferum]|uniref:Uncharacterized protein n=1 Tax=Papaver somniferum TaxID=3469 RepID=A0A4Y7KUV6_PAPSO|nr:hypothetical protein C5167_001309 [Papaver somniferum]